MLGFLSCFVRPRSNRDLAILKSVLTALGAKGCGIVLQLLAIPYAVRILGVETYGAYATAAALFAWLSLLEIGIGANVIKEMVAAFARHDSSRIGTVFKSGLCVTAVLSATFAGVAYACIWGVFKVYPASEWKDALPLFALAALLAAMQITTSVATRARAALQQTHINNLFGAAANLVSAVMLWVIVKPGLTGVALLLSLNGPLVLAQLVNAFALFTSKPDLVVGAHFDWRVARVMMRGSGWLAAAQVGVFLEREAPKLILAAAATASAVGHYACAVQILLILAGLVVMISTPLLPAVADAIERGDHSWWRRRVVIIELGILVLGFTSVTVMGLAGPRLISFAFGQGMHFTIFESMGLMVWGTTVLLSHIFYIVLIAAGKMQRVAQWQLSQGIVIVCLFAALYSRIGIGGMFWVSAFVTLLLTFLPWARSISKLYKDSQGIKLHMEPL